MGNSNEELKNDLKLLMDGWNKIQDAATNQFPDATKNEIYTLTKGAMEHALGMNRK